MVKKKNLLILAIYFFLAAVISQLFSGHELLKSFLFLGSFLIIPWHFRKDKFILLSLLAGLVIAIIISYWAPYPYLYDTDAFRSVQFINDILAGKLFWGQAAYLGIIHNLIALVSWLFNFASFPYAIFWALRFVMFPLSSLGTFLFIRQMTSNKWVALLAAIAAPLTLIEFLSLINFAPKIISLAILPFLLFWVSKAKKIDWKIIAIISVIAFAAHFYMGAVNLLVIFSWLFFKKYNNKKIIYGIVILVSLYIALQGLGIINLSQTALSIFGETDLGHYNFSFYLDRLFEYFPILILLVALMGLLMRRNDKNILAFVPALFIILAAYFSPLNASYRVLASFVPLVILLVCFFIQDFSLYLKNGKTKNIFIAIIVFVLLINFCLPYYGQIKKVSALPNNEGHFTILTPEEFTAANWLRDNNIKDIVIISDPVNALTISSLSKNTWALAPEEIIKYVMMETDPGKAHDFIKNKEAELNKKIVIYLDGRTTFWIKERKDQEVLLTPNQSKKFEEFKGLSKFFNKKYFNVLYAEDEQSYLLEII